MHTPVNFSHNGRTYTGILSQVQGSGSTSVYHLTIDDYYKGRLRISAFNNQWVFDGEYAELAGYFGDIVSGTKF